MIIDYLAMNGCSEFDSVRLLDLTRMHSSYYGMRIRIRIHIHIPCFASTTRPHFLCTRSCSSSSSARARRRTLGAAHTPPPPATVQRSSMAAASSAASNNSLRPATLLHLSMLTAQRFVFVFPHPALLFPVWPRFGFRCFLESVVQFHNSRVNLNQFTRTVRLWVDSDLLSIG